MKISVNSKFKDNLVENIALITKLDVSLLETFKSLKCKGNKIELGSRHPYL